MTSALEHGTEDTPGRLGAVLRAAGNDRPRALGRHGPWVATTLDQARTVLTDPATYDFPVDVSRRAVRRAEMRGRSPHGVVAPLSHERAAGAAVVLRTELDLELARTAGAQHDAMALLRRPVARSTTAATLPALAAADRDRVADAVLDWVDALGPVIASPRPLPAWSRARRSEDGARHRLETLLDQLGAAEPPGTATVLAAGTQVPVAAGAWLLVGLAERPEVQDRLHTGGLAPVQVVWEVLRVAPPTWVTARVTRRETTLAGVRLPEGGVVLVSPLLLGRLADLVPAGECDRGAERVVLDPGRWDDATARPGAWLPFGAGPHACPGRTVGLAQLTELTSWAAAHRLDLVSPAYVDQSRGIFPRPALVEIS
ncbi:hypothetical protein JOE61_000894 [Nocardioides salarius]|uniref:Cytochrome P450 n=1 Tax=Nocardioides salarius TaxID=374513 RepID=A0ABS2M7E8_9ACTN|nr:cytochrome P450 [Nocardioides salarius]MBM7507080.1 hypothetical protein [Nocardioides salarius]